MESKLLNYLLDLKHKDGGPKAKFFQQIGYTKTNWKDLLKQLIFDPVTAVQRPSNEHGFNYSLDIEITSANGKRKYWIVTGWFRPKGRKKMNLTTAYPKK